MAVGTDTGEAVQNQHQGVGVGTVPTVGFGFFQPDYEHPDFVPRGTSGGIGGDDIRHDDVADLHCGATDGTGGAVHRLCSHFPRCENQPGTVGRNPPEGGRGADACAEDEPIAGRQVAPLRTCQLQLRRGGSGLCAGRGEPDHSGTEGDGHRWGERKREDDAYQIAVGLL